MVSSEEINRRLEAKKRGIEYKEPRGSSNINSRVCPSCHTENPSTAKFCVGCGNKLETEPERSFKPEIKETSNQVDETVKQSQPVSDEPKITQRPDDFGSTRKQEINTDSEPVETKKLEPIVPSPDTEPVKSETPEEKPKISEVEPAKPKTPEVEPEPPQVKQTTPEMVNTKTEETLDVDPVERIKKAKELLDIGAITQEEFDMIKSRYLKLL
jgi:hypothetical protein